MEESSSSETFYWHDYETFGSNPSFDRPAQFAGLRTDFDLNPVGNPLVLYSRPANDFLPHPEACLVTGLTPQIAIEKGIPECEFIAQINKEFSVPGTCGVGFNSIRFDDEVTRFTLYRNFFDAYEREWRNGNSRWDIIDLLRAAEALRPEGIEWPKREDSLPSFRLEDLTRVNKIEHSGAHDALADVRATISLARLIREKQPRLFNYALSLRRKKRVGELIENAMLSPLLFISGIFGARRHNAALVMPLWKNEARINEVLCFDLSKDPGNFIEAQRETLVQQFYRNTSNLEQATDSLGLYKVFLNRCPMLITPKILDSGLCDRLGIDYEKNMKTANILRLWRQQKESIFHEKCKALCASPSFPHSTDTDRMLYSGGFFSDEDRCTMQKIRSMSATNLSLEKFTFKDSRLPEMLMRYRARNYPESLSEQERLEWEQFRRKRIERPEDNASISMDEYRGLLENKISSDNISVETRSLLEDLWRYGKELLT